MNATGQNSSLCQGLRECHPNKRRYARLLLEMLVIGRDTIAPSDSRCSNPSLRTKEPKGMESLYKANPERYLNGYKTLLWFPAWKGECMSQKTGNILVLQGLLHCPCCFSFYKLMSPDLCKLLQTGSPEKATGSPACMSQGSLLCKHKSCCRLNLLLSPLLSVKPPSTSSQPESDYEQRKKKKSRQREYNKHHCKDEGDRKVKVI